ncbi:hypothetical protein [Mesorhizobium sp. CN2-181]|uniref:hypothetical protein n=1 Tax=Mesorhizobium yinganensis TaxID=3157707 RepID=UPI0032B70C27
MTDNTPDPRRSHRISKALFEGQGDELFDALAEHIEDTGMRVGEAALEKLVAVVRGARQPGMVGRNYRTKSEA